VHDRGRLSRRHRVEIWFLLMPILLCPVQRRFRRR
jgi:hypothetical protein